MELDESIEGPSWRGVPATVILINAFHPSALDATEVAHVATCRLVRRYLRLSNSHYVGVCLYGTEDSGSSIFDHKCVTELISLSLPSLDDYKTLKNINIRKIKQAKELIMSDVLWHCSKMFANCKKQLSSRTIIMLTRLDIPPAESDQEPTFKRVVDLVDSDIEMKIINISASRYVVDPFYNDFLIEINKGKDVILPKPVWDPNEVEQLMASESDRHLAISRLSLELGNGLSIGVGVYKLLKSSGQSKPKSAYLERETNAIVTSVTKTTKTTSDVKEDMDVDQEKPKEVPLLKSELLYYQQYGGERIAFTDKEKKLIQNPFGPPMLKLLGFKPAAILCKEKWFLKQCYFLFPNESIIEGSTVAFRALHQACSEMSMVAICVMSSRVNAKPIIVALSPCSRPLGLDVEIGFDVICVPFMENVRDLSKIEEDENMEISEECKNLMRDILSNFSFDYRPEMFENPTLQSQYRAIEAKALAEDDVEPFIDTTKPNSNNFQNINNELFYELFGPFSAVATKRVAPKETFSCSKRKRVEDVNEELLKDRIGNYEINKYTATELKQILKYKNASEALTGLKKMELVGLVYKYCT